VRAHRRPAANEIVLHFVSYNRNEKARSKSVAEAEAPSATNPTGVRLLFPAGTSVDRVEFATPGAETVVPIEFHQQGDLLEFTVPSFFVHGLVTTRSANDRR